MKTSYIDTLETALTSLRQASCPGEILRQLFGQQARLEQVIKFLNENAFVLPVIPIIKNAGYFQQAAWAGIEVRDFNIDNMKDGIKNIPDKPYFIVIPEQHLITGQAVQIAMITIQRKGFSPLTLSETIALAHHVPSDLIVHDLGAAGSLVDSYHTPTIIKRSGQSAQLSSIYTLVGNIDLAIPFCFMRICF